MSNVEYRNLNQRFAVHLPTKRNGDLRVHDRITTRGTRLTLSVTVTFEAFFTFDDPLICAEQDVPADGVYLALEDGKVEITQLVARFPSKTGRTTWLRSLFSDDRGQFD